MKSSSSKSSSSEGLRWTNKDLRCYCHELAPLCYSRNPDNLGKRFWGCPNYKDKERYCGFFKWIDDVEHVKKSVEDGENQKQKSQRKELVVLKQEEMMAMVHTIVGLLAAILLMLVVIVMKM